MSIINYLPTFKVVEMNRSTGLVAGHVLSNFAYEGVTVTTTGGHDFLENGVIVGLNNDLTLDNFDATVHSQPLLVYTEELITFLPGLKYFANEEDADGDIYPRVIGLYVGDIFTTNNYDEDVATAPAFAKVVAGVLTLQDTADTNTLFAVEESTLPTGGAAYRFTYIGSPIA